MQQVPTIYSLGGAVLILASTAFLGIFVRRQQVAHQTPPSTAGYTRLPTALRAVTSPNHVG